MYLNLKINNQNPVTKCVQWGLILCTNFTQLGTTLAGISCRNIHTELYWFLVSSRLKGPLQKYTHYHAVNVIKVQVDQGLKT